MTIYKPFLVLTFCSCLLSFSSCGGGDGDDGNGSGPTLDACGNATTEPVNDKRCLYSVTTLTDQFDGSGGLTVDANGFIYVADFGNNISNADGEIVSRIDPNSGEVTLFADGLDGPSGNAFAPNGNLIQANIQGNFVSQITPNGETSTFASTGFSSPVGVELDSEGNVFVCNCGGGGSIQKVDANRVSTTFVRSPLFDCPNGLTSDENDNLYVANFGNSNILKITPSGEVSILASLPGTNNSHLVYSNGVIYALSRGANRLYEVTLQGEVSVIAGTSPAGNLDGDGNVASFFIPNGIDVSPDGSKIYVVSRVVGQGSPLNPVLVRVVQLK